MREKRITRNYCLTPFFSLSSSLLRGKTLVNILIIIPAVDIDEVHRSRNRDETGTASAGNTRNPFATLVD